MKRAWISFVEEMDAEEKTPQPTVIFLIIRHHFLKNELKLMS